MIELTINNCFPKGESRELLTQAFHLLTKRLGIADYTAKVEIHMHKSDNPNEGGAMMALDDLAPKPRNFLINLTPALGLEVLSALCHEMVHVRQYLQGDLRAADAGPGKKHHACYHGVVIDPEKVPYQERPWEKEAGALMWPLTEWVVGELDKIYKDKKATKLAA